MYNASPASSPTSMMAVTPQSFGAKCSPRSETDSDVASETDDDDADRLSSKAERSRGMVDLARLRNSLTISDQESQYPSELAFLDSNICCVDLDDEKSLRQGNMRRAQRPTRRTSSFETAANLASLAANNLSEAVAETTEHRELSGHGCMQVLRRYLGRIILSTTMQTLVLLVIVADCCLTFEAMLRNRDAQQEEDTFRQVASLVVMVVFSLDVFSRCIYFGLLHFLSNWLNLMEALLLVFMYIEMALLRDENIPAAALRVLRPMFRAGRILRLIVRVLEKGHSFQRILRHSMSCQRLRYMTDGFDLDLQYIRPSIISMSMPGVGVGVVLHNPMSEVARFMNERHGNKFLVLNTTETHCYSTQPFFYRYLHFPIAWHGVPTLNGLVHLCDVLAAFLNKDSENVIAIHSKHCQGRTCLVIAALLLHLGEFNSVAATLAFIEHRRTDPEKSEQASAPSLDTRAQHRFLEYFAAYLHSGESTDSPARTARIRRISLFGFNADANLEISCFSHPGSSINITPGLKEAIEGDEEQRGRFLKHDECSMTTKSFGTISVPNIEEKLRVHEARGKKILHMSRRALLAKVRFFVEEKEYDSKAAGARMMTGDAIFSSKLGATDDSHASRVRRVKNEKGEKHAHNVQPEKGGQKTGVIEWDLVDTAVTGEICLEVHKQKAEHEHEHRNSNTSCGQRFRRFCSWASCRKKAHAKAKTVRHGAKPKVRMIFCGWLHTSYLEFEEPANAGRDGAPRDPSIVRVALPRFELDKAQGEKSMRSYSSSLRIVMEFQTDRSQGIQAKSADAHAPTQGHEQSWKNAIASQAEVSEWFPLGWLNFALNRIWPYTAPGLGKLLKESIEPYLQDVFPSPLNANIRFSRFEFGESIPELGPIMACARNQEGFEVTLDVGVLYDSTVNVMISTPLGELGINRLHLKGLLSVKLKPIVPELPVIEGVHFFFLNSPELDASFTGNAEVARVANASAIRKTIIDAIQTALYDIIVLPNVIVINYSAQTMASGDSITTFQDILPRSILRLRIASARDIRATSFSFCGRRLPDPYVVVHLGSQSLSTGVRSASANPVWSEDLEFFLYDERQLLKVTVRDKGVPTKDILGEASAILITSIVEAGAEGFWVSLGGERGRLCMFASILDLMSDAAEIERQEMAAAGSPRPKRRTLMGRSGKIRSNSPQVQETVPECDETATEVSLTEAFSSAAPRREISMGEGMGMSSSMVQSQSMEDRDFPSHMSSGITVGNSAWNLSSSQATSTTNGQPVELKTRITRMLTEVEKASTTARQRATTQAMTLGRSIEQKIRVGAAQAQDQMSNFVNNMKESGSPGRLDECRGAVGVVIGRIFGGRVPSHLVEPRKVELRLVLGKSSCTKQCYPAVHPEFENVSADVCKVIGRLNRSGSELPQIADLVDLDLHTVQRILRKDTGWNLELLQRLCVMIRPSDLEESPNIDVEIVTKGRLVACTSIPLTRILRSPNMRIKEEIGLSQRKLDSPGVVHRPWRPTTATNEVVDLDMELRVLSLTERKKGGNASPTTPGAQTPPDDFDVDSVSPVISERSALPRPMGHNPNDLALL